MIFLQICFQPISTKEKGYVGSLMRTKAAVLFSRPFPVGGHLKKNNNLRLTSFFPFFPVFTATFLCCNFNTISKSMLSCENAKTIRALCVCVCACVFVCVQSVLPQWQEVIQWTAKSQGFLQSLCTGLNEGTFSQTKRHDATKDCTLKRRQIWSPSNCHSQVCMRAGLSNTRQTLQ